MVWRLLAEEALRLLALSMKAAPVDLARLGTFKLASDFELSAVGRDGLCRMLECRILFPIRFRLLR